MILEIIVTLGMGIFAGATFLMSHEHSKTKYNYGKNERTIHENVRRTRTQIVNRRYTNRTIPNRYLMSELHETKTGVLFNR